MTFRVGQKVAYVGNGGALKYLKHGTTYTVHSFCNKTHIENDVGIFLCEIDAPQVDMWCACFHPKNFRPVVEKKTDISIFTALLKTKQHERVL